MAARVWLLVLEIVQVPGHNATSQSTMKLVCSPASTFGVRLSLLLGRFEYTAPGDLVIVMYQSPMTLKPSWMQLHRAR